MRLLSESEDMTIHFSKMANQFLVYLLSYFEDENRSGSKKDSNCMFVVVSVLYGDVKGCKNC
jgi:hypothetical protein